MKVTLLEHTPNPEKLVAVAAKTCYSPDNIGDIYQHLTDSVAAKFIEKLMKLGHESPLEHCVFTFGVDGISRACSHQLVRHRMASYSQKSQRYVDENDYGAVYPPDIWRDSELTTIYDHVLEQIDDAYYRLQKGLTEKGRSKEQACEDARYILPNCCTTNIVVTMNARELLHFFSQRCCSRAQWEIRELADRMIAECRKVAPVLFKNAGPDCITGKGCGEGKMSCGKPRKELLV